LYDSFEVLRADFAQGGVDAASLTTEEIMLLGLRPEFIYIPVKDQGFEVRYVLVARRDGAVTDLTGLVTQRLAFFDDSATILAMLWLETLLAEVAGQPIERPLMNLVEVDSLSKAILQVFFRQAQTALVTLEAFELACELNPQLRRELMVLHESQPFVTTFFVFNPDWRGAARERLEEAIVSLHKTPGGQQVLTVFQSSRLARQPASALDATRRFLEDYRRLMGDLPARQTLP
jgi:ABC-type phosphate/phosphonate transport system substrate-binding protein